MYTIKLVLWNLLELPLNHTMKTTNMICYFYILF